MKPVTGLILLAIFTMPVAADSGSGPVPRGAAAKYAAHAEAGGAAIGAMLLLPKEAHKLLHADLGSCCRVVEVAIYPSPNGTLKIDPHDFVLRVVGSKTAAKPSSPDEVVAELTPPDTDDTSTPIAVHGQAQVGLGATSGPYPGQRSRSVDTGGGMAVGNGGPYGAPNPNRTSGRMRYAMQQELNSKALPTDSVSEPVAGYLYFSLSKDDRKAAYQLEYTLNGRPVTLKLN